MTLERFFTAGVSNPYDSCRFASRMSETGDNKIIAPDDWSIEAAQAFAESFVTMPASLHAIEENTLPSWLWQHRRKESRDTAETSAQQVFDRIAGAAAYAGWKSGLLNGEAEALAFYDEIRFMLAHRLIALTPDDMAQLGAEWAYGAKAIANTQAIASPNATNQTTLRNETIDSILGGKDAEAGDHWQKFLRRSEKDDLMKLGFADTVAEWGEENRPSSAPRLVLDLMRFRREDGAFDVLSLRQAVRLSVMLLDLHYESFSNAGDPARPLTIGTVNLAALLMSLALAYDSKAGRATAAAICAIITAEAVAASARLAALFGPCPAFAAARDIKLRALRNHRRAAYGEHNDYERVSILPAPLEVDDGADLVLLAAARRGWDEAIDLVQQHGLRNLQLTDLFASPVFSAFLECSAQGIEPEPTLIRQRALGPDIYRREIHPALPSALAKIGCDPADVKAIVDHAVGYNTLVAAPGVNHALLRERGFDTEAIARLEEYLPRVNDIRHAFTPWILGTAFCLNVLRMPCQALSNPRFNLLRHLGFSDGDIAAANAFCCGHRRITGLSELSRQAGNIFATRDEISFGAQIRMASAVQSFIMGDVGLVLSVPFSTTPEARAELLLAAWRKGLKSVTLYFEGMAQQARQARDAVAPVVRKPILKRKPADPSQPSAPMLVRKRISALMTSPRAAKPKATTRTVSLKRDSTAPVVGSREKRG
jgi:ribonucleotide reductase alpha subunit